MSRITRPHETAISREEQEKPPTSMETAYRMAQAYADFKRSIYAFTSMWFQNEEWLRDQYRSVGEFFFDRLHESYSPRVGSEEDWNALRESISFDRAAEIISHFQSQLRDDFKQFDMTVQEGTPLCGYRVETMKAMKQLLNVNSDYNKSLGHIENGIVVVDDYIENGKRYQVYSVYDSITDRSCEVTRDITSVVRGRGVNEDFIFHCNCSEYDSLAEDNKICSHVASVILWTDCVFDISETRNVKTFMPSDRGYRRLRFIPKHELDRFI